MAYDRSVHRDGVIVDDYAADGGPDAAVTAMLPDSSGGVGSGKNGIGGGSSTDRDNTTTMLMAIAVPVAVPILSSPGGDGARNVDDGGHKGGEATARRLQGEDEATEMRMQSDMALPEPA